MNEEPIMLNLILSLIAKPTEKPNTQAIELFDVVTTPIINGKI